MNKKRDRIAVLIIGLIVGFVVGAIVFKIQTEKQSGIHLSENKVNKITHNLSEMFAPKANMVKATHRQSKKQNVIFRKSKYNYYSSSDENKNISQLDIQYREKPDSIFADSVAKALRNSSLSENNNEDDIVIKKDQLILTKDIEINHESEKQNKNLDSLIDYNQESKYSLKVEFWESPINYKGYKMSKSKIVLFGINPYENPTIQRQNNSICLLYRNDKYLLEYSDEFIPFRKISNNTVNKNFKNKK
ncbi:MAG: hypothetical protein WC223_02085 [Bacteroidales bacterium]|jgi:uncharacterized membrane-anchored protein YhcB (DUF1043 family)